jgi:hypothetical protein
MWHSSKRGRKRAAKSGGLLQWELFLRIWRGTQEKRLIAASRLASNRRKADEEISSSASVREGCNNDANMPLRNP